MIRVFESHRGLVALCVGAGAVSLVSAILLLLNHTIPGFMNSSTSEWFLRALAFAGFAGIGTVFYGLFKYQERERRFNQALTAIGELSVNSIDGPKTSGLPFEEFTRRCNEIVAEAIEVDRVGIWLLSDDGEDLNAVDIFERDEGTHEGGLVLHRQDYPNYFEALTTSWAVGADDAETHPMTSEFRDGYLRPLNIKSMLDSMLYSGDKLVGVLCHEQKHHIRRWSSAEIRFAGSAARLISLALEIDARRQADRRTRQALVEAEQANNAKTSFLMNLSHEVRTPLNAIIGFAQLGEMSSRDSDLAPELQSLFEQTRASGLHLLRIFEDLLDVSQIELGVMKFTAEDVELDRLLEQLKATISDHAKKKSIEVSIIASPGLVAHADRRLTLQVLINLVVNSIKYSDEGTKVRVTAIDEVGEVSITVADQGIGMDEAELERAVQRFERLENYFSAKEGGVGIGLPLSKQMVEIQGGTLKLASEKGVGTTVTVTLPLATKKPTRLRA